MVIDLHGLTEAEAIPKLETFLYSFANSGVQEATIVTGSGIVLRDLAIETIVDNDLQWREENNNKGALVVFK